MKNAIGEALQTASSCLVSFDPLISSAWKTDCYSSHLTSKEIQAVGDQVACSQFKTTESWCSAFPTRHSASQLRKAQL